jgi:hypothetical protein
MYRRVSKLVTLAFVASAAAACEGEGGSFDQFVGVWEYLSGNQSERCPRADGTSLDSNTDLKGALLEFREGVDAPLVIFGAPWMEVPCPVRLEVNGSTASARPGQKCTDSLEDRDLGVVTITNDVVGFMFTVMGVNANETSMAALELRASRSGMALRCTSSITGMLKKLAK